MSYVVIAFQSGDGMIFVWKNLVTSLLSVRILFGFGIPQKICPNILKAYYMAKNSFAYIDIFCCKVVKVFDP